MKKAIYFNIFVTCICLLVAHITW